MLNPQTGTEVQVEEADFQISGPIAVAETLSPIPDGCDICQYCFVLREMLLQNRMTCKGPVTSDLLGDMRHSSPGDTR